MSSAGGAYVRDLRTGRVGALSERSLVSSAAPDLVPGDTNGVADVFVSHPR
ncbi:hypothetical protein [Streptomyces sp. CdTB01]|uniref:hypothetical protein n=1 Tax=Streptomyces sp. CdTB01 TaxID=1725411 RepID=UPI000AF35648|nr:hypothetical protein [Streptomyces sp. CdTB01]